MYLENLDAIFGVHIDLSISESTMSYEVEIQTTKEFDYNYKQCKYILRSK